MRIILFIAISVFFFSCKEKTTTLTVADYFNILLLHGGPAMTHEYMECFESFFPKEGFEFYEYDQLGSYYSDQPKDSSL